MSTTAIVRVTASLASACLLCGTLAYAEPNKACVNFGQSCFGFSCDNRGTATCTNNLGIQVNWNRIKQDGYVSGNCQAGKGDCKTESFNCMAEKFWNDKDSDRICNESTHRCTDTGQVVGCKDS
jgi:hypothetical protein